MTSMSDRWEIYRFGSKESFQPAEPDPSARIVIIRANICLNFWDEVWWFLSLRIFRLLSSSSLLYLPCFGQCILGPSSDVELWSPHWTVRIKFSLIQYYTKVEKLMRLNENAYK